MDGSSSPARASAPQPPPSAPAPTAPSADGADVTGLLLAWEAGDRAALEALLPLVYAELRRQARRVL